jgi:hypothetical protein
LILDSGASLRSLRRQHGLPLDDGVVSGIATIISNSPAVATIARVRKAALDHSQNVTPKIGEEFHEELRFLSFNLVVSYWISRF